jgi:proteasome lid subunit RPN8/RPN11
LSHDGIVFDDVKYREPERRLRPDGDRRWACLAYEVPRPSDLPIFLDRMTADAIERHALRDTTVELGGILLGKECIDEETGQPFVWITKSLEAKHYENTQASFTYTHDSWEEITRERDLRHPDLDIVGWYHTHPDFGIFLSSHDLFIHRHFFAQPLQVAYVVDPIRQTRGFFQWRDGDLEQVGGYMLFANRADRVALARLVNDLENLPNTEASGGLLSPRLEAELLDMLTRPATAPPSAFERTQSALLSGVIGCLFGVVLLAAVLWLQKLGDRVAEQTERLQDLERSAEENRAKQSLALDALLDQASGAPGEKFARLYDEAVRDRDDARRKLVNQGTVNDELTERLRTLAASNRKLQSEHESMSKEVDAFRAVKKDHPDIETRLETLTDEIERKSGRIQELDRLLDNAQGKNAIALTQSYDRAWYAAVAGWSATAVLTLAVLALLTRHAPTSGIEVDPRITNPPPHQIL